MELNMMKKIFDRCLKEGTGQKVFIKLQEETNINSETLIEGLKLYYRVYASDSEKALMKEVLNKQKQLSELSKNKFTSCFEAILKTNDKDLIIKYLSQTGINNLDDVKKIIIPALNSYVSVRGTTLPKEKLVSISNQLDIAIQLYKGYIENEAKRVALIKGRKKDYAQEKRDLDHIVLLEQLKGIAESPYQTSKEYFLKENKDDEIYQRYLNVSIKRDRSVFENYSRVMINKMKNPTLGKEDLNYLIDSIKNGIDGRVFDILDYYQLSNVPVLEMTRICCAALNRDEYTILKTFLTKYMYPTPLKIEDEFKTIYKITVDNELVTVAEDIKIKTYEYLVENNLPLYHTVFEAAVSRVINNMQKKNTL